MIRSLCPAEPAESGGPQDPYSDASAKYGPLKLPELQPVDLSKMYGGAAQVRKALEVKFLYVP